MSDKEAFPIRPGPPPGATSPSTTMPGATPPGSALPGPGAQPTVPPLPGAAVVARALGHPARIGIVAMLHQRQSCIGCDIVDRIGLAQSTTSEHLRILKAAGIITGRIERPRVCYSLNPEALEPLRRFIEEVSAGETAPTRQ